MMRLLPILTLLLLLYSCEEYFVPEIEEQTSLMVFEGLITNELDLHSVKITKSVSFVDRNVFEKGTGYRVYFEDDLGEVIELVEGSNGLYKTLDSVAGSAGRSYRMVAVSPEDKTYYSTFELMENSALIDTISGQAAYKSVLRYYEGAGYMEETLRGIEVLDGFIGGEANSSFYRYEYELIMQSYQSYPYIPFPVALYITRQLSSKPIEFISVVNSRGYANEQVVNNQVQFISEEIMNERMFIEEYSTDMNGELWTEEQVTFTSFGFQILLRQYSLSEKGFDFWDAIYKQSQASGHIFDPVESQIYGNVYNAVDSTEMVFGYFGASAISEKGMYLRLEYNDEVSVKPIHYFPTLDSVCYSQVPPDYWVY